ncbi:MAG TPA: trigger factor, partial [Isosphaeraceae bacterium]|nr:trigger factor [Isosphaeraceae bacterium]
IGDYLTADLTFLKPDGGVLNHAKEVSFRLQSELRFQDGQIPKIGSALEGIKPGEARELEVKLGSVVVDPELRGKTARVKIEVQDLKEVRMPEVNSEFITSIGFDSLEELRNAVGDALKRRHESLQKQAIRRQVMDTLIAATPFELPAELVSRQEKSTTSRLIMELRQEGRSDSDIKAQEAEIRANAHEMTRRSLKEFFILARIADASDIKVEPEDLELEIEAMAERSDESIRRIRTRIEKEGLSDALVTQILERKALDHILRSVEIEDVPLDEPETAVETLDQTATPQADEA